MKVQKKSSSHEASATPQENVKERAACCALFYIRVLGQVAVPEGLAVLLG